MALRHRLPVHLYELDGSLYLNITNRCPVSCVFCIKKDWQYQFHGQDLKLGAIEPPVRELLSGLDERLGSAGAYREIVFCGFGEPTMRMDAVNAVGLHIRLHHPDRRIRLNTIGLGNLLHGRDIVGELSLFLDAVSVSINTADPVQWEALHRPQPEYKGRGFAAAVLFAQRCLDSGLRTRLTAVKRPEVDMDAVRELARSIGAEFFLRPALA